MNEKEIEATILLKLNKLKIIGGVHTSFDNLPKGFPKHLRGDVKKYSKNLMKKGWLLSKPTSYGLQVSLNKEKLEEIFKFIEEILNIKL